MQQAARRGLEQGRGKDIERAEGHPQLAQEGTHFLGQMLQSRFFAADHAAGFDQGDDQRARLRPGLGVARGLGQLAQGGERFELRFQPCSKACLEARARHLGQQRQIAR